MNIRKVHETMTEEALSIDYTMRGYGWVGLSEIVFATGLGEHTAEFILEQMVCRNLVQQNGKGQYSLTTEYRGI